jgi:hypothetical protein
MQIPRVILNQESLSHCLEESLSMKEAVFLVPFVDFDIVVTDENVLQPQAASGHGGPPSGPGVGDGRAVTTMGLRQRPVATAGPARAQH